jgi:hypothetical protein
VVLQCSRDHIASCGSCLQVALWREQGHDAPVQLQNKQLQTSSSSSSSSDSSSGNSSISGDGSTTDDNSSTMATDGSSHRDGDTAQASDAQSDRAVVQQQEHQVSKANKVCNTGIHNCTLCTAFNAAVNSSNE